MWENSAWKINRKKILHNEYVLAQKWKYNGERLENKNGDWIYLEETWMLPNEEKKKEGQAIRNSLGSVLNVNENGKGMYLKLKHNTILYTCIYFSQKVVY